MACSNSPTDKNNIFFPASNASAPTLILAFGAYKNWGRWNHNTQRIQSLADYLVDQGYSVQLQHDEEEKGDGWVVVLSDGNELARLEDVQHNRNYSKRVEMLNQMGTEILEKIQNNNDEESEVAQVKVE